MSAGAAYDPLIGQTIGSYTVQRKLGEGGMGAVYEVLHPGIGKRLALKLLHAEYAARPQIVQRFFDEARAVNVIGHPNIVDIIDFNNLADGRAYLMMEFLEGDSLSAYIRRAGALPVDEAVRIVRSIASALGAAHENGIVHRDLKPENVHLVPRPDNPRYVKVLDFGIAKLSADLHSDPSSATRSGVVMGTPTYMSPEQAMGRTKEIDHRTDIYALGIILYEMLTGSVPFQAESFGDLMLAHLQTEVPPLSRARPDLNEPWNQVVQRALAKDRDHRFQSMQELVAALDGAARGIAPAVGQPTVAASPGAIGGHPPAVPGAATGPQGTMAYGQGTQPPPQTYPPSPHPSTPPASSVVTDAPSKKPVVFAVVGVLAAVAAVIVFFVMGGKSADRSADPPPVVAAVPVDAAVVATAPSAPPDAAPVAAPSPPDAAPTPKQVTPTVTVRKRGKGTVKFIASQWADVRVDGKAYGSTPVTVELTEGRHKVEFSHPDHGTKTKRFTVKADRSVTIKAPFK